MRQADATESSSLELSVKKSTEPVRRAPSLHLMLLSALLALFLLAAVLLYFGVRSYGNRAADRSYDHLLQASALSIADSVANVQGQWQVDLPYAALDLLAMAPQDRAFYRVIGPKGQTLTGYADLPSEGSESTGDRHFPSVQPHFFVAEYRGESVRFVRVPRFIATDPDGATLQAPVWVQVGQTRLARQALADDIFWRAAFGLGALMLATFLSLAVAVHWSLRPLSRLKQELAQREASDLRPLNSPVPRELDQLVSGLNDFMSRLAVNLEALRTFIAEAAHQMRTPLAALIAQAQDGLEEDDPAQQRHSLQVIERNAMRLRRLLNQLISDASVSHQEHLHHFETLDVMSVLQEAAQDVVPRAEPRPDVRIAWARQPAPSLAALADNSDKPVTPLVQAWVQGDVLMLREAFKNLIDNALKYGQPERGPIEITLRLSADGKSWEVDICDHGPGIPLARSSAVFDRFVRVAQGNGEQPAGAGLGLAIVRRVLDSHAGHIQMMPRIDGQPGLRIHVQLPVAAPPQGSSV